MLNVVNLMGRLVQNPEIKYTSANIPYTRFSIAVEESYVKPGNERKADFFDIVAWRNTAEFICKYFAKGRMIVVAGELKSSSYTDRNGIKRKEVTVTANSVYFGDSKRNEKSADLRPPIPEENPAPADYTPPAVPAAPSPVPPPAAYLHGETAPVLQNSIPSSENPQRMFDEFDGEYPTPDEDFPF